MSAICRRLAGSAAAAALALLVAACGTVPEPVLAAAPESGGEVLADPSSTLPPLPTTSAAAPTTTPVPSRPTTTARPPVSAVPVRAAAAEQAGGSDGPGAGWRRVGGDEFNGPSLDTGTWTPYHSPGGFGNGLRRPEAISQSDGLLRITARGDVSGGMAYHPGQLYGRWEFRARTDKGRGFGSAILLWPDSEQWPRDGELDIMEVPSENRDRAHVVVHWDEGGDKVFGSSHPGDYSKWHTFALDWLPDRITWYVDGVKRFETTDKKIIPTEPMHLTIQLDQGPKANWIDAPDETTPDELSLEVDWVRIYQR
ncbi:glycoside hydrolase family 16 protein [Pseudonocardia asaccharolytica]|uniref:GH16 domain-containing protein n=1 Tax=Pseudonocardia asaccharolytica DSM 44247 = NBRC 16224 TaxID=1123024 RepID=A0A511CWN7_9PSEU|nr:glycoside hydrolase family 16 protein [Pseudonocardia asaccharolytica]GEL16979.1 hypothetical protein PA7_08160 [Pseudonocardia asaccharolytica DSM 44247 = NBRC 16224]